MTRDALLPLLAIATFCAICALLGLAMHAARAALVAAGWPEAGATAAVLLGAVLLVMLLGALAILLIIDWMEA